MSIFCSIYHTLITLKTLKKEQDEKLEREEDEGIEVEEEVDEELEEEMEKVEARSRQIYDPKTRTYDDQRRRVTDLKECSRVTLPKPLDINNEALIEMRRSTNDKIYENHREKECNKKGEVEGNLSEDEKEGLRSLQKRMKNKEIVILKTDKSGKLVVTNREEYIKMGLEHTKKDEEVTSKEVREMEKQVNGHVFFWVKMWGSGDSHGQRDRIIDSKVVSSASIIMSLVLLVSLRILSLMVSSMLCLHPSSLTQSPRYFSDIACFITSPPIFIGFVPSSFRVLSLNFFGPMIRYLHLSWFTDNCFLIKVL